MSRRVDPVPGGEIRYDDGGGLDEVVLRHVEFVHLEYMDGNHVWLRLDRPDGSVVIDLTTKRAKISGHVQTEGPAPRRPRREGRVRVVVDELGNYGASGCHNDPDGSLSATAAEDEWAQRSGRDEHVPPPVLRTVVATVMLPLPVVERDDVENYMLGEPSEEPKP